jgi:hypothetical protein
MKKFTLLAVALLAVGFAGSALAVEFKFQGDLNNRFMVYTNQAGMFSGSDTVKGVGGVAGAAKPIDKDRVGESWAEIKYRLWVEAATDDGKVKGVYAIEVGALRFGNGAGIGGSTRTGGGNFSGDGINVETRWAYTDFQLPGVVSKARFTIGLAPFVVNDFVWNETAMGVQFKGTAGAIDYTLAWVRGVESFNNDPKDSKFEDLDALLARVDLKPVKDAKVGLFALYQRRKPGPDDIAAFTPATHYQVKLLPAVDLALYTFGTDGSWTTPTSFGNAFLNWDLIYQGGTLDDNTVSRNVSAYLAHLDLGANFGKTRLTYTGWYASGDDNRNDGDVKNFMSTDVDRADSIIFFESYNDDNYFTEAPHILDKGLFFNKLALDYKHSGKLSLGGAVLYLQTAKDLTLGAGKTSKKLGTEIDAYLSYMLYANTEIAINAGYLFAGDGMDAFEKTAQQDGKSDANVFVSSARVRYKF